ncbi:MAG: cell division ATP-binding protein FtsE [Candidatus Eremiobacteraeota bacterium]|nr:cell division ATP-binding protein FtsE [Candidatus Eremiobacteraeota bacterium]
MIEFKNVSLVYPNGTTALRGNNVYIAKGEFVFLVGQTGSGKTSFLRLINREVLPTKGEVFVNNRATKEIRLSHVPLLRRNIGVVFQDFKLLDYKTVFENVAYVLEVTGTPGREIPAKVSEALKLVNLWDKEDAFPEQLSGGEQQRASIARALVNHPLILLADEPTGNLDPDTSWEIMQILMRANSRGTTVVVATHNKTIVDLMRKRVIGISGGKIAFDRERSSYLPADLELAVREGPG